MTSDKNKSGRIYGLWALVLAICGLWALYGESEVFFLCNVISLAVWASGCEKDWVEQIWLSIIDEARFLKLELNKQSEEYLSDDNMCTS